MESAESLHMYSEKGSCAFFKLLFESSSFSQFLQMDFLFSFPYIIFFPIVQIWSFFKTGAAHSFLKAKSRIHNSYNTCFASTLTILLKWLLTIFVYLSTCMIKLYGQTLCQLLNGIPAVMLQGNLPCLLV